MILLPTLAAVIILGALAIAICRGFRQGRRDNP
jgi:hypothetical protein